MKRTDILCPNCFKGKLLDKQNLQKEMYCDRCGQEFIQTGHNSVKYK